MVFVHARNATVKTAMSLKDSAVAKGHSDIFAPEQSSALGQAEKQVSNFIMTLPTAIPCLDWGLRI